MRFISRMIFRFTRKYHNEVLQEYARRCGRYHALLEATQEAATKAARQLEPLVADTSPLGNDAFSRVDMACWELNWIRQYTDARLAELDAENGPGASEMDTVIPDDHPTYGNHDHSGERGPCPVCTEQIHELVKPLFPESDIKTTDD